MNLLFLGDIVGTPGVNMVKRAIPMLRERDQLDLVVANAENASAGSGLYPSTYKHLREAGIDALTMGDHLYKKADIIGVLEKNEPICKPANYPEAAPGKDHLLLTAKDGTRVAVVSLLGRTFMKPVDCPFLAADRVLARLPADVKCILVDVHAEATGDKYQLLHYLKGRVSAVFGTHTHVPTADEQILDGTAFICDVGMTGPYGGVLGRKPEKVLPTIITFVPAPFEIATDDVRLGGALVTIEPATGKATSIKRLAVREAELPGREQPVSGVDPAVS